jgi:hypothetical protein
VRTPKLIARGAVFFLVIELEKLVRLRELP